MKEHVCPWWLGYLLANPLRRYLHNPEKILRPYIAQGMTALDVGCGMGFFSLPMARMVGDSGKVICVDLQEKMIKGLVKRAQKAGLAAKIEARMAGNDHLGLEDMRGTVDFALAFALVHEVQDKERLLIEIAGTLKQQGTMLIAEPRGHVTREAFDKTVSLAQQSGFEIAGNPVIRTSHTIVMRKK